MEIRKSTTGYRLEQWAQITAQRTQSGQSIADFCQSEGISRSRYSYWQRKLREAACEELVGQEEPLKKALPSSGWVQVESSFSRSTVQVEINGCTVSVSTDTDADLLVQVCWMLKRL